ncbi:MAG: tetratricopeptide repeat protein [Bacteroidota bacterium]
MKKLLCILHVLVFLQLPAQKTLNSAQWQEDLRFLQSTVHKDYSFLFVKTTPEIFDAAIETLYTNIPDMEEHEIIVGMSRIIALFEYGHTDISFNQKPFEFHNFPFNLYEFNDGIYLQGVHKDYERALGAEVLKINEVPILDARNAVYPAVNSENEQYFKAFGINYLRIPEVLHAQGITDKLENSVTLTLSKDGTTFTQTFKSLPKGEKVPTKYSHVFNDENWLEARDQTSSPLYLKHLDKIYFFEYLAEEKAVYVRHSQIQDDREEDTQTFYTRVFDFIENNDVEKLILDLRLNGGGNNYKNKPVITGIIETKKINKVGSLFVIIGRRTFSACQNLVNELDNYTNVTFVGEPTAENLNFYGDTRPVALPNSKIPVYLSFAWWQDKPVWENADWTTPNIPIDMSFEEYRSNQDPVLEAALAFAGTDFKPDPMQYIVEMYSAGKMQELAIELSRMVQDPRYDFFDFETELSKSGSQLLNSGREEYVAGGLQIFSFVTQLFPNSPSAWKNLGESYLKTGDKSKAAEFLEKAIALDPDGEVGKQANEILKESKK